MVGEGGRGQWTKEYRQPTEARKDKKMDSALEPPERNEALPNP